MLSVFISACPGSPKEDFIGLILIAANAMNVLVPFIMNRFNGL